MRSQFTSGSDSSHWLHLRSGGVSTHWTSSGFTGLALYLFLFVGVRGCAPVWGVPAESEHLPRHESLSPTAGTTSEGVQGVWVPTYPPASPSDATCSYTSKPHRGAAAFSKTCGRDTHTHTLPHTVPSANLLHRLHPGLAVELEAQNEAISLYGRLGKKTKHFYGQNEVFHLQNFHLLRRLFDACWPLILII